MAESQFKAPKGTRDIAGVESEKFSHLEAMARQVFSLYRFSDVRTPIFESIDLFSRSLGATSDVVEKEMFTFTDRGERTFALRPEGTAGVARYFIENKLSVKGGVHRFYYMGPMFRAERPQAGRFRQFWQIGSEHFGDASPAADVDTIHMIQKILSDFGLKDFSIQINSLGCKTCRGTYRKELLKYLESKKDQLNEESKRRMTQNPLRILDSKEDGPKLMDAPLMKEFLCEPCSLHYQAVGVFLTATKTQFEENPRLVRGLDYYTRTVFEIVSKDLGAQNALAAGGRYDDLVAHLGGPSVPGVGFALGMDRVVSALKDASKSNLTPSSSPIALVAPLLDAASTQAFALAYELRQKGVAVPPIMVKKKVKNILSQAVDIGAKWAILIGEEEISQKKVTVKHLDTREQITLNSDHVSEHLLAQGGPIATNQR